MAMKNLQKKRRKMALRPFLGAMLMASGLFQLAIPAFGITSGGQQIDNTATATYDDQDPATPPINATSNTVTITVAEVAGITVVPAGVVDPTGGSINTNDIVGYNYTITNTGNDTTSFFLPGESAINVTTANGTADSTQFATGNNATPPTSGVQVIAVNGTPLAAPIDVPAAGGTTDVLLAAEANAGVFNPGDTLTVAVNILIQETVATAPITVEYGDTPPNDNTAPTQNQPITVSATAGADVTTSDVPDATDGVPGAPANGEREAAAVQTENLNTVANNLALATVEKVASAVNDSGTTTTAVDDVITYDLNLTVESVDPSGTFTPGSLTGTDVQVDGVVERAVLVSDVIPTGTVYNPANEATLAVAAGWIRVYAIEDPANFTPIVVGGNTASATNWTTVIPADPATITRIGFVLDLNGVGNAPIPAGTRVGGAAPAPAFQFEVTTSGLAPTGGEVNNIAQVFGDTVDVNNVADPEAGIGTVVYDESGDQDPNNFEGATPPDPAGTAYDPVADTGIANPAADGIDNNNNNTGVGPQGEDNQVVIVANPVVVGGIFNGPNGQAQAIGPTNDNDDFTNLSSSDNPLGSDAVFDPAGVTFTNTVENPATATQPLDNVTLVPLSPTEALAAQPGTVQGVDGDIPIGTIVTIQVDLDGDGLFTSPDETGVYVYDGTTYNIDPAAPNSTLIDKNGDTVPDPTNFGSLAPGATFNYNVIVDPPAGTAQTVAIPVPIVAYPENLLGSGFDPAADSTNNITVDRLYTGYIDLVKEARLLNADGTPAGADGVFTATPAFSPLPDQIIEYRITYTNISEVPVGANNVTLNADNLLITEDGTIGGVGGNNWALDNDANGEIDTSNVIGTVNASQGTTAPAANSATDLSGVTAGSDVPVYTNTAGTVLPQANGTLTFQRRVNNSATPAN